MTITTSTLDPCFFLDWFKPHQKAAPTAPVPKAPTVAPVPPPPTLLAPPEISNPDPGQQFAQASMDAYLNGPLMNPLIKLVDFSGQPLKGQDGKPLVDVFGNIRSVKVHPWFREANDDAQPITPAQGRAVAEAILAPTGALTPQLKADIAEYTVGRGYQTISTVTQALVSAGGFDPSLTMGVTDDDKAWFGARELQSRTGGGIDCAGFTSGDVEQLIAAMNEKPDAEVHAVNVKGSGFNITTDSRFTKLGSGALPDSMRAGDVVGLQALNAKPGSTKIDHYMMLHEAHDMTAADKAYYASPRIDPKGALKGDVRIYYFDSSWGGGSSPGDNAWGGVARHIFFYNKTTGQYAQILGDVRDQSPVVLPTPLGLYSYNIQGVYRLK